MVVPRGEGGSALPSFYSSRMRFKDGTPVTFRALDSLEDLVAADASVTMKIDVEGTEDDVLSHGRQFLASHKPNILRRTAESGNRDNPQAATEPSPCRRRPPVDGVRLRRASAEGFFGGGRGIRTREAVARLHALQACPFVRSGRPPGQVYGRDETAGGSSPRRIRTLTAGDHPVWRRRRDSNTRGAD